MQTIGVTWFRRVLVAAVACVVAATPGAALASTHTHVDATGDVQQTDRSGDDPVVTDAPENEKSDIVRVRIAHTNRQVRERVKVRDLAQHKWLFFTKLKTSGRNYYVSVGPSGRVHLAHQHAAGRIRCPGKSATLDHEKNTVGWRIPRDCLNNPRWVRFGTYFGWWLPYLTYTTYADQAFADGGAVDDEGYAVYTYSKRLRP